MSGRLVFLTVTDAAYFPGTVATVNSVLRFHPEARIVVVNNHLQKTGLTPEQRGLFTACGVEVHDAAELARPGRKLKAWELKAYAVADLTDGDAVLAGIDSDCVLCGRIDDVIAAAESSGNFHGGRDGAIQYGEKYGVYGIPVPVRSENYISTSLYVCVLNPANREVIRKWALACDEAIFGGGKVYPGHGDQGVLNAVLFAERGASGTVPLDNRLWSQHHCYWHEPLTIRDGALFNVAAQAPQRSLHSIGTQKFWSKWHLDKVLAEGTHGANCAWFLTMLWFGRIALEVEHLSPEQRLLLVESLARFRALVADFLPRARASEPPENSARASAESGHASGIQLAAPAPQG
jgi:hypothetical protein